MNDRASTATARIQLAFTYRDLKQLEQAAQEAKQAREIAQAIEARPLETEALYAQGEVERTRSRHEEALKYFSLGEAMVHETADPELIWRLAFGSRSFAAERGSARRISKRCKNHRIRA
jgi:tetratricopeptide (TPR) repeat protein